MSGKSLEILTQALENTKGRTPLEVLDAFCPTGAKIGPFPLVPLTAGHDLFLARVKHPLSQGGPWGANDVAMALFAFTRPSKVLFQMIELDTLEDELFSFLDEIPMGTIEEAAADLMAHWIRARTTAVAMESPHPDSGSKKKRASAGG